MESVKNISIDQIKTTLKKGTSKIAPLWSLENFVAVNPYLGMADQPFEKAMSFLHQSGGIKSTLPLSFYIQALEKGLITKADIQSVLNTTSVQVTKNADTFINDLYQPNALQQDTHIMKTFTELAGDIRDKECIRFMVDRISFWASAYFDHKQAIWNTSDVDSGLFSSWKKEAAIDRTPEVMGIKGFRKVVAEFPENHWEAAAIALSKLQVPESVMELYLTTLLMKMNGWAGIAARIDWDARLAGMESNATEEFLAILLVWEATIQELIDHPNLANSWKENLEAAQHMKETPLYLAQLLVLQKSFDIANQRQLISRINTQKTQLTKLKTPKVQSIFCIDVRSELFRRNLEAVSGHIETMGFAGFFAFPVKYVPLGFNKGADQCPVLLTTSHTIKEALSDEGSTTKAINQRVLLKHAGEAWKSFKLGAVTCFSFVGPVGLAYLPKLFTDMFGLTRPVTHPDQVGISKKVFDKRTLRLATDYHNGVSGIPIEDRIKMAATALKAMSLTEGFARIVMITGHGSSTVNNPHATGLDCGACGGHTGESNAKVAAAVLNDKEVRKALVTQGIEIPETTLFVAALHDTTTDQVKLYQPGEGWPVSHTEDIQELEHALNLAGEGARQERGLRMGITTEDFNKQVLARSKDWSQVRPEWGLAGCSSFVVAPRERTQQLNLGGKSFLHSYDWQKDKGFGILELIMTAPMVVTSWINLQYYASTVDNEKFGSGNKALHNVVGGLGVQEGFGGDLRTGLPWQSVHDGDNFQHEPQRLNVFIEAPIDEMSKILNKHEGVKNLCDHEWIYLFAINAEGKVAYRYVGNLEWEIVGY
ncbi:MAG: DUF2309 domain-containing protein [Cytophagaceae bacterium]